MAPVKVMCPEPLANTLCIAVLFESRDFTAASFPRSAASAEQRRDAILGKRLGVFGSRLYRQRRPRIYVRDVAQEVHHHAGL